MGGSVGKTYVIWRVFFDKSIARLFRRSRVGSIRLFF